MDMEWDMETVNQCLGWLAWPVRLSRPPNHAGSDSLMTQAFLASSVSLLSFLFYRKLICILFA